MNAMNMAGFNAGGNPALGNIPMANNVPNGVIRMPEEQVEEPPNYEGKLNALIYEYFCIKGQYDSARAIKNSHMAFDPPLSDGDVNGMDDSMQNDSKDGIDKNRPDDLPDVKNVMNDGQGGSFLLGWFALFWDIYFAQRKDRKATQNAMQYVQHNQQQARMRQEQQQRIFSGMPMDQVQQNMQHMMRYQGMQGENLRQRALQNRQGGMQPTQQQIQNQMRMMGPGMRRGDFSEMDMNGQRPRTPSASDHAPSPSKRQRMDGAPFNGAPMMANGRGPPQGLPPGMMGGDAAAMNANQLLMNNGINPGNLSDLQFASFQQQNPAVQQKSIQVYAQNLAKNQRQQSMSNAGGILDQGSPIMDPGMGELGPEFYGGTNPGAMQMRGAPPNVPNGGVGGNHALQDYQMQLMLLEQQNKKRLLMARQEQDTIGGRPDGQPGMPGAAGFVPGMSPGSRGGPSPGPNEPKRGTPKMGQVGLPPGGGSPMPDGSMRNSPAAMNFNQMNPDIYTAQMNGNPMRPPPSSNPGFPGPQLSQQHQMEAMARAQAAGRGMPNGWQQGPQGQAPMMGQTQPQQPAPMGTPQARNNDMPPPQGVPAPATNGRPASPAAAAPPTPSTTNKGKPKGKKDTTDRKRPTKKNSTASVAATPASEAESANPPTPTPATPSTPHPRDIPFTQGPKAEGQGQANMMSGVANGGADQILPPQPDPNAMTFGIDGGDQEYAMPFNPDLNNPDLLENFDFEQFLQNTNDGDFNFDSVAFPDDAIEAGMPGT